MVVIFSGCGQQEPTQTAWQNSATGEFFVVNPTPYPIPVMVDTNPTAKSAKTAFLASGQEFGESVLNPGATATVAGCIDATQVGGSYICYEDDPTAMQTASDLAYSTIQQQVESWAGNTGNPEIVVIRNPGGFYGGVHQSSIHRIIIAAQPTQQSNIQILAHELTHAAFYRAQGTNQPSWLNETIAVWSETAIAKGKSRIGIMTPSITSWNGVMSDYVRSSILSDFIDRIKIRQLNQAITSPNLLEALTGMSLPAFTERFWIQHQASLIPSPPESPWQNLNYIQPATAETLDIPAYGAVYVQGKAVWSTGGIWVQAGY